MFYRPSMFPFFMTIKKFYLTNFIFEKKYKMFLYTSKSSVAPPGMFGGLPKIIHLV